MAHLTLTALSDYVVGRLDEPEFSEASDHLEFCPDCREQLFALEASNDQLIAELRGAPDAPMFADEPEMAAALAAARSAFPGNDCEKAASSNQTKEAADFFSELADYRIVNKIGQGGMGVVYAARHTKLDRPVAVKVLRSDRLARSDSNARFMQELRAIGKLDHPNIVRAYDAREADGQHFLVMELVNGIDLSALVDAEGVLPVADACELVRQAAVGLQHAHEHNLVHRDVKPSNLMLSRGGVVKLLDLGLSRLHAEKIGRGWDEPVPAGSSSDTDQVEQSRELTESQQVIGSIDYMAPEQCLDGRAADARSDIYGLGATLFKLLTGRAPYASREYDTLGKKLAAVGGPAPTPIKLNRSDLPPELVAILGRMLAKDPKARFQTAGEVAEALAPLARGQNVQRFVDEPIITGTKSLGEVSRSAETSPAGGSRRWFAGPRWPLVAAAFFAAAALAVVLLQLRTPYGELVVEVPEGARDKVQVRVENEKGNEIHVVDADNQWSIALREGEWRVDLRDESGTFQLDRNVATITRSEAEVVRVTLKPSQPLQEPTRGQTTAAAADERKEAFECSVYTMKYRIEENAPIRISGGLTWRVMPRYVGYGRDGRVVDERITVVLIDEANSFWPVIMKMSLPEAQAFRESLSEVVSKLDVEKSTTDTMDCILNTRNYEIDENGRVEMPQGLTWKILRRFTGTRLDGYYSEERPVLIVEDFAKPNVWPVVVGMPPATAKSLLQDLSNVIAQKAEVERIANTMEPASSDSKQPPKIATLKTREGFYVRAVKGGGDNVVADVREPRTSEQFMFEWLDGNKRVRIYTRDGFYLHPELGGGGDLDAEIREPGTSEVFEVEWLDESFSRLRLKTREGYYVRAVRGGGGEVVADVKEPGTSEVFTLSPVWFQSPDRDSTSQ
jgi:serine/threonine protein kinase